MPAAGCAGRRRVEQETSLCQVVRRPVVLREAEGKSANAGAVACASDRSKDSRMLKASGNKWKPGAAVTDVGAE